MIASARSGRASEGVPRSEPVLQHGHGRGHPQGTAHLHFRQHANQDVRKGQGMTRFFRVSEWCPNLCALPKKYPTLPAGHHPPVVCCFPSKCLGQDRGCLPFRSHPHPPSRKLFLHCILHDHDVSKVCICFRAKQQT